jgi:hypothetical protein
MGPAKTQVLPGGLSPSIKGDEWRLPFDAPHRRAALHRRRAVCRARRGTAWIQHVAVRCVRGARGGVAGWRGPWLLGLLLCRPSLSHAVAALPSAWPTSRRGALILYACCASTCSGSGVRDAVHLAVWLPPQHARLQVDCDVSAGSALRQRRHSHLRLLLRHAAEGRRVLGQVGTGHGPAVQLQGRLQQHVMPARRH